MMKETPAKQSRGPSPMQPRQHQPETKTTQIYKPHRRTISRKRQEQKKLPWIQQRRAEHTPANEHMRRSLQTTGKP
jgi:hypothetical protein